MTFYRAMIKTIDTNGILWIEIFASKDLKHIREYAKRYAGSILKKAGFSLADSILKKAGLSLAGKYSIHLPFCRTCYFYKNETVRVVIEKVEKITHEIKGANSDLDEEYALIKTSRDIVEYKTLFEYAPGLWSTTSIL